MALAFMTLLFFVPEDYTMNQLVLAIKEEGYAAFKVQPMRCFVKI